MTTQRLQRAFAWLSVLLLVAGAVVFIGSRAGGADDFGADAKPPADAPPAVLPETGQETKPKPSAKAVPREARIAAGQFILSAVGREDLKKAWQITHPDLKEQCGCTYKQWLTGNINVDYYPVDSLDLASFAVNEVRPDYVVLHVALLPNEGSDVKPQSYFIGVRAVGTGAKRKWLVDYFAPYASIEVPALPEG